MKLDAINIYYKNYLAEIGGIETMTYNLARKYAAKKDILFLIKDGEPNQIARLQCIANVEKYNENRQYYCKKVFITYETKIPENIHSDHRARVSHGDLIEITKNGWKLPIDETVTEDYGVSRNTCASVKKVLGKDAIYCPNPFIDEKPPKILKLISPQRMTWEKGKDRIKEIARQLEEHNIVYQWLIVCNNRSEVEKMDNPNLIWMKSRLDIKPFIQDADYLVLVSDCEGSPMSPQEALMVGTPIIVTDLPCYKDFNIDENYGFFLKKDLSNLDVEEIYRKKDTFNFKWTPPKDIWGDILLDGKVEREIEHMKLYLVKATGEAKKRGLFIKECGKIPNEDETFKVTEERLSSLMGNNLYKVAFVKEPIELKDEPKKEPIKEAEEKVEEKPIKPIKKATRKKAK